MARDRSLKEEWLLDGEQIVFDTEGEEARLTSSDDQINEKYVKGEVRIVTEQARYPISTVAALVNDPSYKISPEYQRRHRWALDRKSKLIESLIINVPIPPIFLYEYEFSKYEVMDGLQRLTAINDFYNNRFELEGLEEWPELNGRTYAKLPSKIREGIDRRYLSSVILLKETAQAAGEALRLKQLVFERINSGGVRLEAQETRNAIFDGKLNQLCIFLSRNESLCKLWGIPLATKEEVDGSGLPSSERVKHPLFRDMTDVELVLRFFAYRQKHRLQRSGESLETYLDNFLRKGNLLTEATLATMRSTFEKTISLADTIFGERAFYFFRKREVKAGENWSWLERPSLNVYDPLLFVLSAHTEKHDVLVSKAGEIVGGLEDFYRNNYEVFEGRNVNPSALVAREEKFKAYLAPFVVEE